jgi:MoaA/NifB/PqqE/SkfB family radical SAM enzyme
MLDTLQIETTNLCNAKCFHCAHQHLTYHGTMTDDLYFKIVIDAMSLDPPLKRFVPLLTGEPFMDKDIVRRVKFACTALPQTQVEVFTNGSLMSREAIDAWHGIPNLVLMVSLNGGSVAARKRITGLDDYTQIVEKIHYLESVRFPYSVLMPKPPVSTQEELDEFNSIYCKKTNDMSRLSVYNLTNLNFAGTMEIGEQHTIHKCSRALSHMTVLWNGLVNLCCMDALGRCIFGNLNKQTIKEVWYSSRRQEYISMHLQEKGNQLPVCCECNHCDERQSDESSGGSSTP